MIIIVVQSDNKTRMVRFLGWS